MSITTFATVVKISAPFNAMNTVEIKLAIDPLHRVEGEIYLRVPTNYAGNYVVGDIYAVQISRV